MAHLDQVFNMNSAGSDGKKKSACNAGDLDLILGSERSPGEENGYPLQYYVLGNVAGWAIVSWDRKKVVFSN